MNKAESVKLEVFSLILNPVVGNNKENSFEDLYHKRTNKKDKANLFSKFAKDFISHIDLDYTEVRTKAFTLSTNKLEYGINKGNETIWGVLKGGSKGAGKTKSPLGNKNQEIDLTGDVINDKFFFMINLPIDSNIGYLFFQVYGNESIRSEFIQHISKMFKIYGQYKKPICTPILPNTIRDDFKNDTKIIGLTYNKTSLSSAFSEDPKFKRLADAYNIEITIRPKGKKSIPSDKVKFLDKIFSNLNFNNKKLDSVDKKKVSVKNTVSSKTSTYELDTSDVMPRIYLKDLIEIDPNGTPNTAALKVFCDELLEELTLGEFTKILRK